MMPMLVELFLRFKDYLDGTVEFVYLSPLILYIFFLFCAVVLTEILI